MEKLKKYMTGELCPSQTGFVSGQGVFPNVFRVIKRIKFRTDLKKNVFGLFVDFKCAYNHVSHSKLFERLSRVLSEEEIAFQKAIYSRIKIQSGDCSFSPNSGVAQGSIVSPAFFNIYVEPLYWKLNEHILLDDIFGYADDLLILCDSLSELQECSEIIEVWSKENNLFINKSKFAVLEFSNRRGRKLSLVINETFAGFPIVDHYKYLGVWLNQKLTLDTHISHMNKKISFIRSHLSPALYNTSLDFRKSLWQLFIVPSFEFGIPIFYYEQAKGRREIFEKMLRNSFKSFTGLKKTVKTSIVNLLMNFDLKERSQKLCYDSEEKWRLRCRGEFYKQVNNIPSPLSSQRNLNLCKNAPKSFIKFVNLQVNLCPYCAQQQVKSRCDQTHLQRAHNIGIDSITSI